MTALAFDLFHPISRTLHDAEGLYPTDEWQHAIRHDLPWIEAPDLIDGIVHVCLHKLKGRWPEAEPVLLMCPAYALDYARRLKIRDWPQLQTFLLSSATTPAHDLVSAAQLAGQPWPEAEHRIALDPLAATTYAVSVLKGRFPAAEGAISQSGTLALTYAKDALQGRFRCAEPFIAENPFTAYRYATEVLKSRWPLAENVIRHDHGSWLLYTARFPNATTPTHRNATQKEINCLVPGCIQLSPVEIGQALSEQHPTVTWHYRRNVYGYPFDLNVDYLSIPAHLRQQMIDDGVTLSHLI